MNVRLLAHPGKKRFWLAIGLSLGFIALIASPTRVRAQNSGTVDQPYLVFVADESVHLRCGPAGDHYQTDPVRHGQELEVYVETSDGWLGVRPVEESFCWVVADAVRLDASAAARARVSASNVVGSGEITEEHTVAWIGTNLGRARRYRWQVQLGAGEEVTILGSAQREGADGPQLWYRIVPPSGEFRWIHQNQVVLTAEELVARVAASEKEESIQFLPAGQTSVPREVVEDRYVEDAQNQFDYIDAFVDDDAPRRRRSTDDAGLAQRDPDSESPRASELDSSGHQPRSLSQRITEGLSVLVNGRPPLEPITRSSRRVVDLVPIAGREPSAAEARSELARSELARSELARSELTRSPVVIGSGVTDVLPPEDVQPASYEISAPAMHESSIAPIPMASSLATPSVPREQNTQISIVSSPRLIGAGTSPAPLRSISATQLDDVRRQVHDADSQSLPSLFSMLVARGASAPEIALIAEAAERLGNAPLAARAREYQSLARRRDGDTIIRTASLSPPIVSPPQIPAAPTSASAFPTPSVATPTRVAIPTPVPVSGNAETPPPTASSSMRHEGTLVKVYSADPDRPPFALTDNGGRTLAYVTPAPGVDLQSMLGSAIVIDGQSGFLRGLDTPHILATDAERLIRR